MNMNKIAGSLYKQLMLETGLASVLKPAFPFGANAFIGLATLSAIYKLKE